MSFTQRQRPSDGRWKPFGAAIPVGLLLGFLGPFGSYPAYSTATRYAFWLGLTLAGVISAVAAGALPAVSKLRTPAARIGLVALLSAVPMTFVVAWTMSLAQPGRTFTAAQLPALFAAVAAVQLLIVFATTLTPGLVAAAEASATVTSAPNPEPEVPTVSFPPALLQRLPPAVGHQILAIETEDHYLRVHTDSGSALILMRMGDAVAMLDPALGLQVHRRWWVAEAAVMSLRGDGQRLALSLADGSKVPVGRTFGTATRQRFAGLRTSAPVPSA